MNTLRHIVIKLTKIKYRDKILKAKEKMTNNTRRSQQQNNLGRSTDKRPGGQNGGNHCHRTEYRKKE